MNKLTDAEIVKALNICTNEDYCKNCPLDGKTFSEGCINYLRQQSFDLIDSQQAEIERLNKEVDRLSQCVLYHDGQKVDAIKEFIEWLQANGHINFSTKRRLELVKEMVGDIDV